MTLYGLALFVHVASAIVLVGGSAYTHIITALMPKARTVDGIRSHATSLHTFTKAEGPIAGLVLVSGLYMAFAGHHWGRGWPLVSLALFAAGGAAAFGVLDPKIGRIKATVEETADGPVTPELGGALRDPTLLMVSWTLAGADLAIIYLMTNKPGWVGSLTVAAIGLALGALLGLREIRPSAQLEPPTATPPPPAATV